MSETSLSAIERCKSVFGKSVVIVRPGLSLTIYTATPVRDLAPQTAGLLETFISEFPEAVLDAQLGPNSYKQFGASARNRLLKQLRSIPENYDFLEVHLKEGLGPQCGRYAFHFESTSLSDLEVPLETNLIVFEWPAEFGLDSKNAQRVARFCRIVASQLSFTSGSCGFAFQHTQSFPTESMNAIQQLMPRYLGFDPSYRRVRLRMRGHLPSVQWITLIGSEMVKQHAELRHDSLRQQLPNDVLVEPAGEATIIVATALPFVGDSNRLARDLGAVPHVARLLRRWRYTISAFGGQVVDARQWLSRFDER